MVKSINYYLNLFGFYPKKLKASFKGIPFFLKNKSKIKKQIKSYNFEFKITSIYPCLNDRFDKAGNLPLHYFYQDLFVANRIFKNKPVKHVDIGSRIDGFAAHIASFREIEIFDIRELKDEIKNIIFIQADLMDENFKMENYCDSISSLHAIEHFGLGRYGDKVDIAGHIKGLNNIYKLLKTGGKFYFSTPIGKQRIEFDAHRVFSVKYLLQLFKEKYKIESFSYVNDKNDFFENVSLTDEMIEKNFLCNYGCGIFEMTKV
ncbi:MAG: DUF268 domain-containing protein [Ignavibacteriaceae bacterium]